MDIFDFALKMELDGEKYYTTQAEKAKYVDLKKVLEVLANDERRHYQIIKLAQVQTYNFIEADASLSNVPNVFAVNNDHREIPKLKDEQLDIYQAALMKERESVELYKKLKDDSKKPEEKLIFEKLMQEEEKHVDALDNIIELLNRVNDWVEDAEFNHKEIY